MKKIGELLRPSSNAEWEVDRIAGLESSERRAWMVAKGAGALAALSVVGIAVQSKLRQVVYVPIVVDKATGETEVGRPLAEDSVSANDALDKKCAGDFVRARFGYSWDFLSRDRDTVARMASPEVFAVYDALYYPKAGKGLHERAGRSQLHRINILSRRLTGPAVGGGKGMVVNYEMVSTYFDRSQPDATTRHVATLTYVYQPKVELKDQDRAENPFGWICTACRSDPIADAQGSTS